MSLAAAVTRNEFRRNLFALTSASVLAQIAPLAAVPILSRLYTPAEFGVLAVFLSLANVLAIFATAQFELGVAIPRQHKQAFNLVALALVIAVGFSALAGVVLFAMEGRIAAWFGTGGGTASDSAWVPWVAAWVLAFGAYQVLTFWHTRWRRFKLLGTARMLQAVVTVVVQIPLGWLGAGAIGLVVGNVAGHLAGSLLMTGAVLLRDRSLFKYVRPRAALEAGRRYSELPRYGVLNGLLFAISEQAPNVLLARLVNVGSAGAYSFGRRVAGMPTNLLAQATRQVLLERLTALYHSGESMHPAAKAFCLRMAAITALPFGIVFVLAPDLFAFIFGAQWRGAGELVRLMVPWLWLALLNVPISGVVLIHQRQRAQSVIQLVHVVGCVSALAVGLRVFESAQAAVGLFSAWGVALNLWLIGYHLRLAALKKPRT